MITDNSCKAIIDPKTSNETCNKEFAGNIDVQGIGYKIPLCEDQRTSNEFTFPIKLYKISP